MEEQIIETPMPKQASPEDYAKEEKNEGQFEDLTKTDDNNEQEPEKKVSRSTWNKYNYKKKGITEAKKKASSNNLAIARKKKEEKKASEYKFQLSESDDEELIIRSDPVTIPKQKEKLPKENQPDPRYESLQNELLQMKKFMIKQQKQNKKRENAININVNQQQPPVQQPQESEEQRRLREKILMQFN